MKNPREAAASALVQMETQGAYSNLLSGSVFSSLSSRDRAFAAALFSGVLERRITLDAALAPYLSRPLEKQEPVLRCLLRLGVYQLLYSRVPERAGVNETVALAKSMGRSRQAGFVNAVLRSFIRGGKRIPYPEKDPAAYDSLFYSCPLWLVRMWRSQYGLEAAGQILSASIGSPPLYGRVNTLRTTPQELCSLLKRQGISAFPMERSEEPVFSARTPLADCLLFPQPSGVPGCSAMQEGLFHIQDTASQLCCAVLNPQPGETVVDVCAAPGGKTFTIGQRMENRGCIHSFDLYPQRVELIRSGARRLGLTIVQAEPRDALLPDPLLKGKADRVLCDAVCSGLGTIRRKPEIKYKPSAQLDGLPSIQEQILEQSAEYLKPGGVLVYSTCTLNRKENEGVTRRFLQRHPDFLPDPFPCIEGYTMLGTLLGNSDAQPPLLWEATLLPGMSDGFYLCRMRKQPE